MSGICGFFHRDETPAQSGGLMADMMSAMEYWGPNGREIACEGPTAFGHLSLDVFMGVPPRRQPLLTSEFLCCADARIDNRAEVLKLLEIPAPRREELSDAEIVLAAYQKWREQTPDHLVGAFAFAVWDKKERSLYCARDHYGCRPLFFHYTPRLFAFASAIKGLFPCRSSDWPLRDEAIADFLVDLRAPGQETFYESIYRLPPGHFLIANSHRVQLERHWHLDALPELRLGSDEGYRDAFRQIFEQAVSVSTRSARHVGIFLSGGLDSSAVGAVAAKQLAGRQKQLFAYCSVPSLRFKPPSREGWVADETPYVEALVRQYSNIRASYVTDDTATPLTALEESFDRHDRPTRAATNRIWIERILKTAREQGVGVLLTGQFGNVTISWRGFGNFAALARKCRWFRLASEIDHWCRENGASRKRTWYSSVVVPLLPLGLATRYFDFRNGGVPGWGRYSPINPAFANCVGVIDRFRQAGMDPYDRPLPDTRAQRRRYLAAETPDLWASWGAAFGIEIVDPTADRRVIEFCLSIPDDQFLRQGASRCLVRGAMRDFVPPDILDRGNRGEQGADAFLRFGDSLAELHSQLQHVAQCGRLERFIDLPRMDKALRTARGQSSAKWDNASLTSVLRAVVLGRFLLWHDSGRYRQVRASPT